MIELDERVGAIPRFVEDLPGITVNVSENKQKKNKNEKEQPQDNKKD